MAAMPTFQPTVIRDRKFRNQTVKLDSCRLNDANLSTALTLKLKSKRATPSELADFTSGMPDEPDNLPRNLEMRSIHYYTTRDFLQWISRRSSKARTAHQGSWYGFAVDPLPMQRESFCPSVAHVLCQQPPQTSLPRDSFCAGESFHFKLEVLGHQFPSSWRRRSSIAFCSVCCSLSAEGTLR